MKRTIPILTALLLAACEPADVLPAQVADTFKAERCPTHGCRPEPVADLKAN